MPFQRIAIGVAHRAKQYRVSALCKVQRFGGQRMAGRLIGRAANQCFFEGQSVNRQRVQYAPCLGDDFGTNSVPG